MDRRIFLKQMAKTLPIATLLPHFPLLADNWLDRVKITDVKCLRTQLGLRVSPLVKIETDQGVIGIGECHHDENGFGAKDIIENALKPILLGQDPFDLERLLFKMGTRTSYYGGNHGIATHAITGVEMALWDIIGKITGQPVHKILGGGSHVNQVRAYLNSGPKDRMNKDSCAEYAETLKSQKYTAVKINVHRDQKWFEIDNRRISNVEVDQNEQGYGNIREALGNEIDIVVHCHWEFDFDSALRLCRAVAPMRPWWIEDPLPIAYNEQWVKLTEQSPAPILCGENLYTRDDFRPFIVNQGAHMIEIDVSMAGGLLEAKKIADLAELYYMPVATHNVAGTIATVASAHLAASVREFLGHEMFPLMEGGKGLHGDPEILGYDRPLVTDGHIQLSDKPGFGIELNETLLKNYLAEGEKMW
ncbi:mandelate racemase/muconate lactonizing enzyme family protein [Lunatibacter salilacus]|uniref:mandelate racemase/muconate lactonizing enzyme family protein n=1 Tax=Lunatibacter salilacus TaxID=2483804 RepID=UPI00131B89C6|nr:mandelate racemase/muconate lactonizing enzyme family protein [Lunatibacter salilacus]